MAKGNKEIEALLTLSSNISTILRWSGDVLFPSPSPRSPGSCHNLHVQFKVYADEIFKLQMKKRNYKTYATKGVEI